tara:strand:+ start:651 stop:944 length:294 start_codon:yes stop_codon:yes gene_type:complete
MSEEPEMIDVNDMQDHVIKCSDCGKPLLQVVKVRDSDKFNRIIVNCYSKKCGGSSFLKEIEGDLFFAPAVHVYEVTDMDYDEDDNLMTIQVRKKKGS